MAKFQCDIVCFVNIANPMLAAERTGITVERTRYESQAAAAGIEELSKDFSAIMESIARTVATKQTILDIYKDRSKLDDAVTKEVESVFPRWGLELVDLEIKDIKDIVGSTIIADIEKKIAAEITAAARVKVAQENRNAVMAEVQATQEAEVKRAETEQTWKTRRVEADREVAIKAQNADMQVADMQRQANEKKIEATRKLEVGQADINRQITEQNAAATKLKMTLEAEGYANQQKLKAEADSEYIKQTKLAEAAGIDKVAEAQQKFKDGSIQIEYIKANKDVQLAMAKAYEQIATKANINIMTDSSTDLFKGGLLGEVKAGGKEGFALSNWIKQNPDTAAAIASMITAPAKTVKGEKA
jgi:regulator of protease activity HflC (stomatin/prohibitin superfamily)